MLVKEKLLIFLHLTTRLALNRDTQERFSYSGSTISRYINSLFLYIYIRSNSKYSHFYKVLNALIVMYPHFVTLPSINTPLASRILDDTKYFPYFNNYLSALDSTHIPIHVPLEE